MCASSIEPKFTFPRATGNAELRVVETGTTSFIPVTLELKWGCIRINDRSTGEELEEFPLSDCGVDQVANDVLISRHRKVFKVLRFRSRQLCKDFCKIMSTCCLWDFDDFYQTIRHVNNGAFGQVYTCTRYDKSFFQGELVVKIIEQPIVRSGREISRAVARFKRRKFFIRNELSISEQLIHENIVRTLDILVAHDRIYLIQPLMHGDLGSYADEDGDAIPAVQYKSILRKIALGIQYMGAMQVVHRDLKPNNVLVKREAEGEDAESDTTKEKSGTHRDNYDEPDARKAGSSTKLKELETNIELEVKICDFGLARKVQPTYDVENDHFIGTLGYQSPEQIQQGSAHTTKVDSWGLGVMAYELLTKQLPFHGHHHLVVRKNTLEKPFITNRIDYQKAPDSLKDLIGKLLEKDPDVRLTATQALEHKYFMENEASAPSEAIKDPEGTETETDSYAGGPSNQVDPNNQRAYDLPTAMRGSRRKRMRTSYRNLV